MALLEHFNLDLALIIQSYAGESLDMPLELTCWYEGNKLPETKMPNLKYLIWNGSSLKGILNYKNIIHLDLKVSEGFAERDISPLAELKLLISLNLHRFNGDISPLAELKSLTHLDLYFFEGDISPLAGLILLTNLDLHRFNGDISPLAELISLTSLDLSSFKGDISPLSRLPSLTSLDLRSFEGDKSILKHLKCSF